MCIFDHMREPVSVGNNCQFFILFYFILREYFFASKSFSYLRLLLIVSQHFSQNQLLGFDLYCGIQVDQADQD